MTATKIRGGDTSTKISHVYFGMQSAAEIQNCAHIQVKIRGFSKRWNEPPSSYRLGRVVYD